MVYCHQEFQLHVVHVTAIHYLSFVIDTLLEVTLFSFSFLGINFPLRDSVIDLEYADDIVLFGEIDKSQSFLIVKINDASLFRVRFSSFNCKTILQDQSTLSPRMTMESKVDDYIDYFIYLKNRICVSEWMFKEISVQTQKARLDFDN